MQIRLFIETTKLLEISLQFTISLKRLFIRYGWDLPALANSLTGKTPRCEARTCGWNSVSAGAGSVGQDGWIQNGSSLRSELVHCPASSVMCKQHLSRITISWLCGEKVLCCISACGSLGPVVQLKPFAAQQEWIQQLQALPCVLQSRHHLNLAAFQPCWSFQNKPGHSTDGTYKISL